MRARGEGDGEAGGLTPFPRAHCRGQGASVPGLRGLEATSGLRGAVDAFFLVMALNAETLLVPGIDGISCRP